jgi:S1-C subfamily serine protease
MHVTRIVLKLFKDRTVDDVEVLLVEVSSVSRAASVGLRVGDVVLKIDNKPTDTLTAL